MAIRHNLRSRDTRVPADGQKGLTDRFLDFVETAWGIGQIVWSLMVILFVAAVLCAAIMAAPSLLVQFFRWVGTLIFGAGQAVFQNPLLLVIYALALFITFLILWVPSALNSRRNTGHERGRKVLTAADARRAAARHLDRTNESSSRKPRLK
ncbi:hypothetical protein [Planctomicrobium sp. SH527]|uniref:hypothetical protein n=1 Tax=Planctomicrobium sp. SH527 TaxID=3448123 RepID=UPI003F5BC9E9